MLSRLGKNIFGLFGRLSRNSHQNSLRSFRAYSSASDLSSFGDSSSSSPSSPSSKTLPERILIGFTCKVCNHRTHRTLSKVAYTRGVVLIECPGCSNRHLIADNLGWFDQGEARNIKDIAKARGEQIRQTCSDLTTEQREQLIEYLKAHDTSE